MGLAAFIAHFDGEATSALGGGGANGGKGFSGAPERRAILGLISRGRARTGLRPGAGLARCQRAASASSGAWAPLIQPRGLPWPLARLLLQSGELPGLGLHPAVGSAPTCCTRRLGGPCVPPMQAARSTDQVSGPVPCVLVWGSGLI